MRTHRTGQLHGRVTIRSLVIGRVTVERTLPAVKRAGTGRRVDVALDCRPMWSLVHCRDERLPRPVSDTLFQN